MPGRTARQASLPAPSAHLIIDRTQAEALIFALGRKRGEKFLRRWVELVAKEQIVRSMLPGRREDEQGSVTVARAEAAAWMEAVLPALLAAVPDE